MGSGWTRSCGEGWAFKIKIHIEKTLISWRNPYLRRNCHIEWKERKSGDILLLICTHRWISGQHRNLHPLDSPGRFLQDVQKIHQWGLPWSSTKSPNQALDRTCFQKQVLSSSHYDKPKLIPKPKPSQVKTTKWDCLIPR